MQYESRQQQNQYDPRQQKGPYDPRQQQGQYDPRQQQGQYNPRQHQSQYLSPQLLQSPQTYNTATYQQFNIMPGYVDPRTINQYYRPPQSISYIPVGKSFYFIFIVKHNQLLYNMTNLLIIINSVIIFSYTT